MHGWLIIDKPLGLTSAQVVGAVKRILRQGGYPKAKIGHGGTLDPLATGVLPIALGEATKLAGRMLDATKGYSFTIAFGAATTTGDAEGEVCEVGTESVDSAVLEAALPSFTGPISQIPPIFSALKVNGERAYKLARSGQNVELEARNVVVHKLHLVESGDKWATLDLTCSKGTYVRSLARDIAVAVGTVGHVSMLRRTKAGPFGLSQAISLDNLEALGQERALEQALLPLTAGLDDIPVLPVEPEQAAMLQRGQQLVGRPDIIGLHLATAGSVPVALVDISADGVRVVRGFNLL